VKSYVVWQVIFAVLLFVPLFQVSYGLGIPGGLEGAIHITHHFISVHDDDDDSLALLMLSMNVIVLPFLLVCLKIFLEFLPGLSDVIPNQQSFALAIEGFWGATG